MLTTSPEFKANARQALADAGQDFSVRTTFSTGGRDLPAPEGDTFYAREQPGASR